MITILLGIRSMRNSSLQLGTDGPGHLPIFSGFQNYWRVLGRPARRAQAAGCGRGTRHREPAGLRRPDSKPRPVLCGLVWRTDHRGLAETADSKDTFQPMAQ